MDSSQCYKLLGLVEGASMDEIKNAYRRLVLEYHPDKNTLAKDGIKFKMITEAYHTIRIKNNVHVKANYRTESHTNKNHQYRNDSFPTWLNLLYSKIDYRHSRYARDIRFHYLKYEPIFFEYCNKIERNAVILMHHSNRFFRHNRIKTVFRTIILSWKLIDIPSKNTNQSKSTKN